MPKTEFTKEILLKKMKKLYTKFKTLGEGNFHLKDNLTLYVNNANGTYIKFAGGGSYKEPIISITIFNKDYIYIDIKNSIDIQGLSSQFIEDFDAISDDVIKEQKTIQEKDEYDKYQKLKAKFEVND